MIEVASYERLDILHVHYAVPHATAAWMAREVLGDKAPRIVTTLHGTDTTLVGIDPNYLPITRFSILRSDAVTTPSEFLRRATWERLRHLPGDLPHRRHPQLRGHGALRAPSVSAPACERSSRSWRRTSRCSSTSPTSGPSNASADVVADLHRGPPPAARAGW